MPICAALLRGSEPLVDPSILLRRMSVIRHCLERLSSKEVLSEQEFLVDADAQDVVLRNLQVGVQAALDIALHVVRDENWQLPGASTGTFDILAQRNVISQDLADRLRLAVQMRTLLVHAYEAIDMRRVFRAYRDSAQDLDLFGKAIAQYFRL